MCDTCSDIEKTIARYQRILFAFTDQVTVDGARELIAGLLVQKAALHPEKAQ